jgi:hypothetical protein
MTPSLKKFEIIAKMPKKGGFLKGSKNAQKRGFF